MDSKTTECEKDDWESISHPSKGDHQIEETTENLLDKSTTNNQSRIQELSNQNESTNNRTSDEQLNQKNIYQQLNQQIILEMEWSTRNLIITTLNEFVALLTCRKAASNDLIKSRLSQTVDDLNRTLSNLKITSTSMMIDQQQVSTQVESLDELILNLTLEARCKIIMNLITNKDLVINGNYDSNEMREYLINENKSLLIRLLSLSVKDIEEKIVWLSFKNDETSEIDAETKKNLTKDTPLNDVQRHEDDNNRLRSLEDQITELKNQIKTEQESYRDQITELKEIIQSEKKKIVKIDMIDVKKFFEKPNKVDSSCFSSLGISWYLSFRYVSKENEKKALGVYLFVSPNEHVKPGNWSIKAKWELRLISQNSSIEDKIRTFEYEFSKAEIEAIVGWGNSSFIEFEDLMKNYVKDDKLIVQVHIESADLILLVNLEESE